MPIKIHQIPLTQALKSLAVRMEQGNILFGVEVHTHEGNEPVVDLNIPPYTSAEVGLRQIFKQLPDYTFKVLSEHFVSVYPRAALADPADPLNLKVKRFDVEGERAGAILTWPERFMPELKEKTASTLPESEQAHNIDIYVGSVATGPLVTLHLRNVTLREILNAVSEASEKAPPNEGPLGWLFSTASESSSRKGPIGYWRMFMTLPHNWLEQEHENSRATP